MNTPTPPGTRKRPYQKPEFQHEKTFETLALTCGKATSLCKAPAKS